MGEPSTPQEGFLPFTAKGGEHVLAEILQGGQSFLWEKIDSRSWRGVIGHLPVRIRLAPDGQIHWTSTQGTTQPAGPIVDRYFAADINFERIADDLPWRSDPVLAEAIRSFPGLRILRQPPEVALLSFLLSPLKRIEQIRAGLLEIARRWGTELEEDLYAPPSWAALAEVSENELRKCGIGYRARSLHKTAQILKIHPHALEELDALSTPAARKYLMSLPGVGRKIADCVLLFGYGRLESFPIDTWISRHTKNSYDLHGFTDDQVQQFASAHYGKHAGVAQQYLFAHARSGKTPPRPDPSIQNQRTPP